MQLQYRQIAARLTAFTIRNHAWETAGRFVEASCVGRRCGAWGMLVAVLLMAVRPTEALTHTLSGSTY